MYIHKHLRFQVESQSLQNHVISKGTLVIVGLHENYHTWVHIALKWNSDVTLFIALKWKNIWCNLVRNIGPIFYLSRGTWIPNNEPVLIWFWKVQLDCSSGIHHSSSAIPNSTVQWLSPYKMFYLWKNWHRCLLSFSVLIVKTRWFCVFLLCSNQPCTFPEIYLAGK